VPALAVPILLPALPIALAESDGHILSASQLHGKKMLIIAREIAGKYAQIEAAREATRREQGEGYATYILDRGNIATELANRVAMRTGVQPPRFRWLTYVDALLFPLDNSASAK
jgi:predicted outer membrane protein